MVSKCKLSFIFKGLKRRVIKFFSRNDIFLFKFMVIIFFYSKLTVNLISCRGVKCNKDYSLGYKV